MVLLWCTHPSSDPSPPGVPGVSPLSPLCNHCLLGLKSQKHSTFPGQSQLLDATEISKSMLKLV